MKNLMFPVVFLVLGMPHISLALQEPTPKQQPPPSAQFPSAPISELVRQALEANPELAAMRQDREAARARIPQSKALPDPMVMFGNNTQGNAFPFAGRDGDFSETYVGVTQEFPWFGIRRLREQTSRAEFEARTQEYEVEVQKLTAEVKSAAYALYSTDRTLLVIKRDLEILDKLAQVAEARYSVGKAKQVDVINARVEMTELLDQQGMLQAKRDGLTAQINAFLYRDPQTPMGSFAEIKISPPPPPLEELNRLALAQAPHLKFQNRMVDVGTSNLELARREAKAPELGVSFIYHNRPEFPDYYTYGVTVKLPLYASRKQRHAIEERRSNLAATRFRLSATESMIRYRLRDGHLRATSAAKLLKLNQEAILPQATIALESSITAYQVGEVDFLTLLTALKRAIDYEKRYWELFAEYHQALAEMEPFVGIELTK